MSVEIIDSEVLPPLIIPAYEPEPKLGDLVDDLLSLKFKQVIVVNDGCSVNKQDIFEQLRQKPRVTVLTHAVNLGKGAALKTAFNHILVNHPHTKAVVTVDADGQHLPQDILRVAQETQQSQNNLVLGVRAFEENVPLRSRFGNVMTRYVFRFLVGRWLRDTQTGLRGVSANLMRQLLTISSNRYEFELEMLIAATNRNMGIKEVSIATVYENGNKSSHFNPFLDSVRIYFVFLRFVSWSLITYCTDLLVFTLTYKFLGDIFVSVVLGRACGLVVSMLGLRSFVFKSNKKIFEVVVRVLTLWLALLGISYGLMELFVNTLHWNIYFSRITVDSTLFLFNFLVQRELIFKEPTMENNKS